MVTPMQPCKPLSRISEYARQAQGQAKEMYKWYLPGSAKNSNDDLDEEEEGGKEEEEEEEEEGSVLIIAFLSSPFLIMYLNPEAVLLKAPSVDTSCNASWATVAEEE